MNSRKHSKKNYIFKNALKIVTILKNNGFKSYFAGGAIRDQLLKRNYGDIDIVSSAKPKDVQALFKKTFPVGNQFGICIVLMKSISFEVASFRKDLDYHDGRHPRAIKYADEKEDAFRRDFTINGLFYDPMQDKILDYVNGKNDIRKKIIRAIGNPIERFQEDKLRILRAIRFCTELQFKIEKNTWKALKLYQADITQISYERIREELIKIFNNKNASLGFKLLYKSKIIFSLFPLCSKIVKNKTTCTFFEQFLDTLKFSRQIFLGFLSFFFFFQNIYLYTASNFIFININ